MGNRTYDDRSDYVWQKGRQLLGMFNGASDWTFYYNADGMRIGRTDYENGTEYTYYYNGSLLRVMTVDGYKLYFVYDASGTPIEVSYTPAGSTTVGFYYFVTNLQGDVIAILNSSGAVVVEYTYDAWGKILSITGSMASSLGVQNPLRYRSYVYDQETCLYYLQSRYYDPEIGRFINADVFTSTGQGLLGNNMFAYCRNNPVNRIDISGFADQAILDTEHFDQDDLLKNGENGGFDSRIAWDPQQAILDNIYANKNGGGSTGFSRFSQLKEYIGSAGEGNQWHHVVEQSQIEKSNFPPESINNTSNIIAVDKGTHYKISGYYSSKPGFTNGLTVREWLVGQSYEFQFQFGINQLSWIIAGG